MSDRSEAEAIQKALGPWERVEDYDIYIPGDEVNDAIRAISEAVHSISPIVPPETKFRRVPLIGTRVVQRGKSGVVRDTNFSDVQIQWDDDRTSSWEWWLTLRVPDCPEGGGHT